MIITHKDIALDTLGKIEMVVTLLTGKIESQPAVGSARWENLTYQDQEDLLNAYKLINAVRERI